MRRIQSRISSSVATAFLMVALSGCNLFDTRDAEAPDAGRSTWDVPRAPGDVLVNLSSALFERNAVNYLRSFDSRFFRFEADPVALSNDPAMAEWDYTAESSHIASLLSQGTLPPDSLLFVEFSNLEELTLGDSARIGANYQLTAGVVLAGAPTRMAGRADFVLGMGSEGYWQIQYWRDSRTEELSTWSDLKSLVK